jgi:excinuclease ABC subunit C
MSARTLREQLRGLPTRPGVYLFRDVDGEILYVGKAKSLRSRVRSYFRTGTEIPGKLQELVQRTQSVETFVVGSEAEALLLEANLIKEHAPRFNIQLRDDKTFPYVKVTVHERLPRVLVTRRLERDGARYFGPFTDVGRMRRALRTIRQLYTVRSCNYDLPVTAPERPCLDYFINRCKAPCVGYQSEADYRRMIDEILEILSGRTGALKRSLRKRMDAAAEDLEFERAAELRDVLRGLEVLERRQTTVDFRGGDRDVLGLAVRGSLACCLFLRVRDGRLLGREVHFLRNVASEEPGVVAAAVVKGAYLRQLDLPAELLVPAEIPDRQLMEAVLSERRGGAFAIRIPQRGRKRRLTELACENAEHVLTERLAMQGTAEALEDERLRHPPEASVALAKVLDLPVPPRSLVCFDVSTLGGRESVGSASWLDNGRPSKNEYRRFRIRGTEEGRTDDYAMMLEIVSRYFHRRVSEARQLPDVAIIDGGRGQLAAAAHAMESAGVSDLPLLALAKREEEIFLPGRPHPIRLPQRNPALHWLQRARDEAHRFALDYNRSLRRKRTLRSKLSDVPGVGPVREAKLLRRFGSVDAIRTLELTELVATPGIGRAMAARIKASLAGSGDPGEAAENDPPQ